jgi:hypothetical protein
MRIVYWIMAGCFFTASFDLILLIDIGGVVRISQLLLALICIAAVARVIQDGRILWPRGSTALAVWLLSQLFFLPLSGVIPIGVQFFVLLSFTIVGFFAVIQLYGKSLSLEPLMRVYLLSYVFVGFFGLLQFVSPLFGFPGILVTQWLLHDKLPRINGFSYEPSFYVTYLMMGWIMLVELRISGARITSGRLWKWITIALTLSLIFSSSKTGWFFMIVELSARLFPFVWRGLRSAGRQLTQGRMVIPLPNRYMLLTAFLIIGFAIGAARFISNMIDPVFLLSGSGLANTPAHSYIARVGPALETFDAFVDHPFIGRSLGGVPIYIASRSGIQVHSMQEVRGFWGFPVIMDVLVASGIFGIIPFLIFVYANTFGALRTAKRYWPSERAKWLRALARAMIFECLLLMVDQNLLRVYVWFHVSMVALIAYNLEFGPAAEPSVAAPFDAPSRPGLEVIPTT